MATDAKGVEFTDSFQAMLFTLFCAIRRQNPSPNPSCADWSKARLRRGLFEYIEGTDNPSRLHSSLRYPYHLWTSKTKTANNELAVLVSAATKPLTFARARLSREIQQAIPEFHRTVGLSLP